MTDRKGQPEDDFFTRTTMPGVPAGPAVALATPEKIGPYPIECSLTHGGMSLLYLGLDPESRSPLAIKVLSPRYVNHPNMIDRFLQEAQIIGMTSHPNIVRLYGQGRWEGGLYIAMEFVQGISLKQFILQNALSLRSALGVVLEVAYALFHLHSHGVIHRDLKPENILMTDEGGVKVIDFGIALVHDASPIGGASGMMGTPVYMAPEQRRDPSKVSFNADIYSLAVICYELVLGKLCQGQIHLELIPKQLREILRQALDPDPAKRTQDIVDFIAQLSGYLSSPQLEQDQSGGDVFKVFGEQLQELQQAFLPSELPEEPMVRLGLRKQSLLNAPNAFIDYFPLPDGTSLFALLRSSAKGVEGSFHAAMARGMVRTLIARESESLRAKPISLSYFADRINDTCHRDPLQLRFEAVLIHMDPRQDQCSVLNAHQRQVLHFDALKGRVDVLESINPKIGEQAGPHWEIASANWRPEDSLCLASWEGGENRPHLNEEVRKTFQESARFTPDSLAESIFRRIAPPNQQSSSDLSALVVCLQRAAE
jgi:serine/threonine protein kinase